MLKDIPAQHGCHLPALWSPEPPRLYQNSMESGEVRASPDIKFCWAVVTLLTSLYPLLLICYERFKSLLQVALWYFVSYIWPNISLLTLLKIILHFWKQAKQTKRKEKKNFYISEPISGLIHSTEVLNLSIFSIHLKALTETWSLHMPPFLHFPSSHVHFKGRKWNGCVLSPIQYKTIIHSAWY